MLVHDGASILNSIFLGGLVVAIDSCLRFKTTLKVNSHRLGRCNFAVLNKAVVKIKGVDVCRSMGHYMMHVSDTNVHPIWYSISRLQSQCL